MSTNYPSLTENTVAVVFNATVHCVSDTLEGLENPTISKVDFLKIITETLECTTEPYGITTTSETCNRWAREIRKFIIRQCGNQKEIIPLTEDLTFSPEDIPEELFDEMASNFDPKKMKPEHYNALK